MTHRAHILLTAAAIALTACGPAEPVELDPMVELQPKTFESCAELESFLDQQGSLPPYVSHHYSVPQHEIGFEDVDGFDYMASDGDFVYAANGVRFSIFAERDQMARAVGAAVVGDEEFGDRVLGVHVDGLQAVVLVGMSQESAPLRDTVLPTRPADAAILRAMVFDVTDPRSPELTRSIFIDGGLDRAWASDGQVTLAVRTGFHNPSAMEGVGRNLPASFPYLYDLHVESGDAWVHQDSPEAFCTNTVTSNVASPSAAELLVTFDLDDTEPGLSTSFLLDNVQLEHATPDAAIFVKGNGRSQDTGREEGTYIYRYATDGAATLRNWAQVTGWHVGESPVDERDGELRVGTHESFWRLSVPDEPGPLGRDEVVWGLLPREEVMEWRFRGPEALGVSVEWEESRYRGAHRYMVWRLDPEAKTKKSIGPDLDPEQVPVAFHLVDADSVAYVTKETETERNDEGEEIPVTEQFRGRIVDLGTTPAARVAAFQFEADVGGGSNFAWPVLKFSQDLYGIEIPKLGQISVHGLTENGVLLPVQNIDHVDLDGRSTAVLDTYVLGTMLWTLSDAAIALFDLEDRAATHYFDL